MAQLESTEGEPARLKLGIIGGADGFHVQELARAAAHDFDVCLIDFDTLSHDLRPTSWGCWDGNGVALHELDLVVVRTMPWGTLEQIIFRVDLLHQLQQHGVHVINRPLTLEIAIDKQRTLNVLHKAGLPVPQTFACQTVHQAMEAFESLGNTAVVKPIFGGEGRGVMRLDDPELAQRAFKTLTQLGAVIYLQEFIDHDQSDVRALFVGDQKWAIRRSNSKDWRTNVSRGAKTEAIKLTDEQWNLARRAHEAVGAWMSGVDLVESSTGELFLLEVNAIPGWRGLAEATGVDISSEIVRELRRKLSV